MTTGKHDFGKFIKKLLSVPEMGLREENIDMMTLPANLNIFIRAFTTKDFDVNPQKNNELLEYVGDGILKAIISLYVVRRFPEITDEHRLSLMRQTMEKKKTLSEFAHNSGFDQYILIPSDIKEEIMNFQFGEKKMQKMKKIRTWTSVQEDVYEAFIASLFYVSNRVKLGSGFTVCNMFVSNHLDTIEFSTDVEVLADPVTKFKEQVLDFMGIKASKKEYLIELPSDREGYTVVGVIIPPNKDIIATGEGKTKRGAESIAATRALEIMRRQGRTKDTTGKKQVGKKLQLNPDAPEYHE